MFVTAFTSIASVMKMSSNYSFRINWNIIDRKEGFSRRFGMKTYNVKVRCDYNVGNNEISVDTVLIQIELTLNQIIHRLLRALKSDDYIRIAIRNEKLDYDIFTPFRKVEVFTTEILMNEIIKVAQSNKEFLLFGLIEIDLIHVRTTEIGGGRGKNKMIDLEKWRRNSKKVIQIPKDGYCVPRAIVVSKAYEDNVRGNEWRRIRCDFRKVQFKQAIELCEKANVKVGESGVNYDDFAKFQSFLSPEYQIIVVTPPKNYYFVGPNADKKIYLFLSGNHCDSLLSIKAFLRCDYFCRSCLKGYTSIGSHICEGICKFCFGDKQCEIDNKLVDCQECKRGFANQSCFDRHKNITKICPRIWKCQNCLKTLKTKFHNCGRFKCKICRAIVPLTGHLCYITPNDKKKIKEQDKEPKVFIFYDFESQQIPQKLNQYIHKPNLCVVNVVCDNCWNTDIRDRTENWCSLCGNKEYVFKGNNTVKDFTKFIFETYSNFIKDKKEYLQLKDNISVYVIAHNSRAYDCQFILKYCVNNRFIPNVIKKGTKILQMKIGSFKFIDSLSFLPMPLRKFPETFGFEDQIEKGCFPFYFNKPGNENYVGNWPDQSYYDPDYMSEKERISFLKWYEQQKDKQFNFQKEIEKYCKSDVEILMRCVMSFRQLFKSVSSIDPLCRSITIAQACMEVFKTNYLRPNEIAICPPLGYEPKRKHSYIGSAWLDYIEHSQNITIIREVKIGRYFVDGIIERSKKVYEYYGCIWHGCKMCFPTNRSVTCNPFNGQSMENLYNYVEKKEKHIRKLGYEIISEWDCKLKSLRNSNKSIDNYFIQHLKYLKNKKFKPPLNPRDSFFGGRCTAFKLFHDCEPDEKIFYYDFTSLYPFVVKRKQYPIGHPIRITNDFDQNITNYKGFIFCKILPPKHLYFPVLPVRLRQKLIFPLCFKCSLTENPNDCDHGDEDRSIVGTWVTMEIEKAIEKGYRIIEIYEIWHFPKLLPQNQSEKGLFTEFINTFIKLKVEASGWPKNGMTESEKDDYIKLYYEKENIKLDKEFIKYNAGMRAIGKLVVVSFWGKFGQSHNMKKTNFINEPQEFFKLLEDNTISVTDALLISDETLQVTFEKEENFFDIPAHSSIIIASFVTSYARLELYNLLDKLGKRVIYVDTDSCIFTAKPGEYIPETGQFIGDLTNEVTTQEEPNAYITRFASCGSKNYAYEVYYPFSGIKKYFCKVKGLSLNFITSNIVNFDSMKTLIDDAINYQRRHRNGESSLKISSEKEEKLVLNVPQKQISVSRDLDLLTNETIKKYRFVYDKRRINSEDYTTIPFGYVKPLPPMPSA